MKRAAAGIPSLGRDLVTSVPRWRSGGPPRRTDEWKGEPSVPRTGGIRYASRSRPYAFLSLSLSLSVYLIFHPSNSSFPPRTATRRERENPTFASVRGDPSNISNSISASSVRKSVRVGRGEVSFPSSLCSLFLGRHFLRLNDHHRRPRYREIIRKICPLSADPRQPPQLPSLFLPNGQEIGQESSLSTLSMLDHRLL